MDGRRDNSLYSPPPVSSIQAEHPALIDMPAGMSHLGTYRRMK
jgi:hypothetical protein